MLLVALTCLCTWAFLLFLSFLCIVGRSELRVFVFWGEFVYGDDFDGDTFGVTYMLVPRPPSYGMCVVGNGIGGGMHYGPSVIV